MIWIALYLYVLGAIGVAAECNDYGRGAAQSILRVMAWPVLYTWWIALWVVCTLRR